MFEKMKNQGIDKNCFFYDLIWFSINVFAVIYTPISFLRIKIVSAL